MFYSTYIWNKKKQNYKISSWLRHQLSNAKTPNCCRIDILQCFISNDGGAANSGGEVVVVVVLVVMVVVIVYWWWHNGSGSGGDSHWKGGSW